MDRRGRGYSGDGPECRLQCEFADIEAVLDAAGQDATLLARSGGDVYALEVALRTDITLPSVPADEEVALSGPSIRRAQSWSSLR
jgi:pimeloyl-ACP methyl ester carboxylesterase